MSCPFIEISWDHLLQINQEKWFYNSIHATGTEKADSCKKWAVTASSISQDSLVVDC